MSLRFFLLAFLGATTAELVANANLPIKYGTCENPPVRSDFKVDEFFNGKWFTWKIIGNLFFGAPGSCSVTDTSVNGSNIHLHHYLYAPMLKANISIEGVADRTFATFKGLRFPVEYNFFKKFDVSIPISIVDTDYENWAVIYFCKPMALVSKLEVTWIWLREINGDPASAQLSEINSALASINLKEEDFTSVDNSHCGSSDLMQ